VDGVVKVKEKKQEKRYTRKIGRMGNSLGVSLPKELAEKLSVSPGEELEFIENQHGDILIRKLRQNKLPENVRPEVLEAFYDVFQEDEGILDDLRDR
jgi:antitoxin MazE